SRIEAIDRDAEVTLVETQRRNDENDDILMFDTGVFDGDEIVVETEEPMINYNTPKLGRNGIMCIQERYITDQ
ncbi:hypothetical protein Tco_0463267, partial [Tanacetum coccineum]